MNVNERAKAEASAAAFEAMNAQVAAWAEARDAENAASFAALDAARDAAFDATNATFDADDRTKEAIEKRLG